MSKANVLASLATDVNELTDLADQVTEIEGAIVRANTNSELIKELGDISSAMYNSGISYSTDGTDEFYDATTVSNTVANVDLIEINAINPADGEILAYNASANNWVNSPAPVIPETPAPVLSFRNKIINGNFDIWQRGTSFTLASSLYTTDRWIVANDSATVTASQSSDVPNNNSKYSLTISSTNYSNGFYQIIEDLNRYLDGKTYTLSAYVKGPAGKTFHMSIGWLAEGEQYTFTGDWQFISRTVTFPSNFSSTAGGSGNTYIHPIRWRTGDTISNSGVSDTIWITQVQFEEGPVATPFEQRPYGLELSLCQRYYEKSFNLNTVPANNTGETTVVYSHRQSGYGMAVPIVFKERKRIAGATTIIYNPFSTTANRAAWVSSSNQAFTYSTVYSVTETGFYVLNYSNPVDTPDTTGNIIAFNWAAEAEL